MAVDPFQPVNFVRTVEDAAEMWRWLSEQSWVAVDTETSGTDVYASDFRVRLVQFGTPTDAWVVDFQRWPGLVEDVLRRFEGDVVMHNSRFDIKALAREGVDVPWRNVHDTMIAMRLAEPTESAALKSAATRHVSSASASGQKALEDAVRKQRWTWDTVPIDFPPYTFYAALDTVLTARLFETPICRHGMASPVYGLEMEVRAICTRMEHNGLKVDAPFCDDWSTKLRDDAERIKSAAEAAHGATISSPQKLAHWFASQPEALRLMTKETAGGKLSVDKDVLEVLVTVDGAVGQVAQMAMDVRRNEKIASAYLDNFLGMRDGDDVVHPQIETIAARTGRMSVREPGLQTLPKHSPDPYYRLVRQAVIPHEEEHVIVSSDYSQIELRIAASLSRDPGLIAAFKEADAGGVDFFTAAARGVYRDEMLGKADPRRASCKTLFYSGLYGASVRKMAWSAGIPVAEMRDVRDGLATSYPGFFSIMNEVALESRENDGWVETSYGRRLPVRADKEYAATNVKIQGTAADVLKRALVNMAHAGLEDMMLVPVHDEVLLDVPSDDYPEVAEVVRQSMECCDFEVPLVADPSGPAPNWAEAK